MPIIVASVGETVAKVAAAASSPSSASPHRAQISAVTSGSTAASRLAEADQQDHDRHPEADRLAGAVARFGPGQFPERTAVLHRHPGRPQRLHRLVDPVQVGRVEGGGLHAEPDGDVGGLLVGGERSGVRVGRRGRGGAGRRQRALRREHVRELLEVGDGGGHLVRDGGERLVRVVQDDLCAVAARLRGVCLQHVQSVLGLGAGQREVVGVVAAVGVLEDLEPGERGHPQDEDGHEVPGAPFARVAQRTPAARGGIRPRAGL
ncbi:hypothetical protein GCM10010221_24520 [Streptomyces parvus]|nr:hypothetical protein GCM10010221_24520 [Streptomyces parvus]